MFEDTYMTAREYLDRVRDAKETIDMLEARISLRKEIGAETVELEVELANARDVLKVRQADAADTISRLKGSRTQLVLLKRYVELKTWEQIAVEMDCTVRRVQSIHGGGLIQLEDRLGE